MREGEHNYVSNIRRILRKCIPPYLHRNLSVGRRGLWNHKKQPGEGNRRDAGEANLLVRGTIWKKVIKKQLDRNIWYGEGRGIFSRRI